MPLDADAVIDRRRLRRRVTFWRALTALTLIVLLGAVGIAAFGPFGKPHVARVEVRGLITQSRTTWEMLEKIAKDDAIKAVVLAIDSPGGTVAGADGLYQAIRAVAAKKPVVAVVEGLAASGGYIAAAGADHIVSREGAIVGSIGVIIQFPNLGKLLDTVGVKMEEVKSSPLKAAPNGYEPTSPEARAALQAVVNDSYGWFKRLVQQRRQLNGGELAAVSDGRVFSGQQALALKLVDQLGHEKEARDYLASRNVPQALAIQTYRAGRSSTSFLSLNGLADAAVEALGLSRIAATLENGALTSGAERLSAEGLLVLWQPPL